MGGRRLEANDQRCCDAEYVEPSVFKGALGAVFVLWTRRSTPLPCHYYKNGDPMLEQWLKGTAGEKMTRDLGGPVNTEAASERTE